MFKNIKTKLLVWYSITIVIVLFIFSYIIVNEFTKLVKQQETPIDTSIQHLESLLILWIPILLIISIVIGYFIIKNALIPVKKTIDEVKEIEANKLEKRLTPHTSNDEIDELVTTFNFMLDKLDDSFSKIKQFSNDVSHELKTPLTIIRGEIELGLRKERTNNEYKNILESTLEETKKLQDLIDSLLFLSKTDSSEIKSKFILVDIDDIITDVIASNKLEIKEKNLQFIFEKFENINCLCHPLLLKILIGNLIHNAIKYSNKDSNIEIYLDNNSFTIKDYGIGIKKEAIKNVFDRFYRVDKARGKSGYGLGLSIVKSIAKLHNFSIDITSKYNICTKFTLNLTKEIH